MLGRLQLTSRGLALRDAGGLIWFLDVDGTTRGLLGTVVLVEGKRTGLTRLEVDYLGPSEGQVGSRTHSCRRPADD